MAAEAEVVAGNGKAEEAKGGAEVADYAPPPVTDDNAMEVIENGNRRIAAAEGGAVIDLSNMGESDSTAICALLEWIAAGRKLPGGIIFRNIQPRQTEMLALYQLTPIVAPYCKQGK